MPTPCTSRTIHRTAHIHVREETVHTDGQPRTHTIIDRPDFALVIPRTPTGIWMVQQYRHPIRQRTWELPQGSWAPGQDGSSADLARTELLQETGLTAARWIRLGRLHKNHALSGQAFDVYLAEDLTLGTPDPEPGEAGLVPAHFTFAQLDAAIRAGQLQDAATLAALHLLTLAQDGRHSGTG